MTSRINNLIKPLCAFAIMALAASCATSDTARNSSTEGEARLAAMLEGRTAGEPRSCISASVDSRLTIIDRTAVVYDAGRTIYVARPENPRSLDRHDVLVINRFGSQLCKQDVIRTVDRTLGFTTGAVFLGDFVPYTRP
jgi:hypothetical protein